MRMRQLPRCQLPERGQPNVSDAKVFGKTGQTVEGLDCCDIRFGDRYLVTYSEEGILIGWE
jgi:hypothetical protein